jgi:hypothetical protein
MEKNLSVFAFKCTIPHDKRLDYKRPNPSEWKFEECDTKSLNYVDMSRRGRKGFISRTLGQGYVSHWSLDENQSPQTPQNTTNSSRVSPASSKAPAQLSPTQKTVSPGIDVVKVEEQLYMNMYIHLFGRQQFDRIEKSFKLRTRGTKVTRVKIPISDLIDLE